MEFDRALQCLVHVAVNVCTTTLRRAGPGELTVIYHVHGLPSWRVGVAKASTKHHYVRWTRVTATKTMIVA